MAYRNKTYIVFDADTDMRYYTMLKAWDGNEKFDFNFLNAHDINNLWGQSTEETIKRKLKERLNNTKVLAVLIGENTKNLHKYVRWEIEQAIKLDIPIIGINLNKKNRLDTGRCPAILRDHLAVHIPYGEKAVMHALKHWPDEYHRRKNNSTGDRYYSQFD